jgi:VWFA-related protein
MKLAEACRRPYRILALLALLWVTPVIAQAPSAILRNGAETKRSSQAGAAADPAPAGDANSDDQQPIFQTNIEVVTAPVTVTDSSGEFVTDLNSGDFRLRDNSKEQMIESFELSWEPISMVVAVETSNRVQSQLADIGRTGILFTQLVLGESGEAAVLTFDNQVNLVQDFTDNSDAVEGALKNLKPGAEGVRLSDAIARAMSLLQTRSKDRRKVVVVLSESRDNGSSYSPGFVLRSAQQLGISIYTVGLSSLKSMFARPDNRAGSNPFPPGVVARPGPSNAPPTPSTQANLGAANLDMLPIIEEAVSYTKNLILGNPLGFYAQGTGARDFSGSGDDAEKALSSIGRELRSQYLLTYRPNNLDQPSYHTIAVAVSRSGVKVRTRPGYMYGGTKHPGEAAPSDQSSPK